MTKLSEVKNILKLASKNGINLLDTAFNYGDAEENLGKLKLHDYKIVTKTPQFDQNEINNSQVNKLEDSFFLSLKNLKVENIYGLLIHRPEDLLKVGAELIIQKLQKLKERGFVEKIGVSIYHYSILDKIQKIFLLLILFSFH